MDAEEAVRQALQTHLFWERKLTAALKSGILIEDIRMIRDASLCSFGEWLETLPLDQVDTPEFTTIVETHLMFHNCVADICQKIMSRQLDFAKQSMKMDYPAVSLNFTRALDALLHSARNNVRRNKI